MAKVEWSAGIDSVSGALSKPSKSGQHSCSKMLLGTHRIAETTSKDCTRIYLRKKIHRSTPVLADELARRTLFKNRAAWVVERSHSLQNVTTDQAAFIAQKDQPGGYKTMKSYLWSLAIAAVTGD